MTGEGLYSPQPDSGCSELLLGMFALRCPYSLATHYM